MFELTLWLISCGWAVAADGSTVDGRRSAGSGPPRPRLPMTGGPGTPPDPKILEAIREFPPYAVNQIADAKAATETTTSVSSWKDLVAYTPFLTEMVAMWYVLQDPAVSNKVKLEVAAALLYAVSPYDADWFPVLGWTDDAAFLTYAFWDVYDHITPTHVEQAKAWLLAHGVDPKPIFALRKEFEGRPAVEDAVEVLGAYGAEDPPALDVAKRFSAKAMDIFSDSSEHVFGPFSATSVGWSRPELSPTTYVVVVTDVSPGVADGLKAVVRSVAYASVVVRAARTQRPGQWVFTFDEVGGR